MKNTLFLTLILLSAIISCGSQHGDFAASSMHTKAKYAEELSDSYLAESEKMAVSRASKDQMLPPSPPAGQEIEKKLIKIGNISMQVKDYKDTRPKLIAAIKKMNGYISEDREENSSYRTGTNMTIRVPKQNFDTLTQLVVNLAERLESKQVSLKDVTEEFVDIQARLRNKREVEKRYTEILKSAKTIREILDVEEHLRKVREEIESKEGRLKYLQSQVSFSTIHLSVYQKYTVSSYKPSFFGQIGDAIVGGWSGLQTFIIGLVYIWPFLLIFVLIFWFVRRWYQSRKAKKNS